jgi:hypothetical protein
MQFGMRAARSIPSQVSLAEERLMHAFMQFVKYSTSYHRELLPFQNEYSTFSSNTKTNRDYVNSTRDLNVPVLGKARLLDIRSNALESHPIQSYDIYFFWFRHSNIFNNHGHLTDPHQSVAARDRTTLRPLWRVYVGRHKAKHPSRFRRIEVLQRD